MTTIPGWVIDVWIIGGDVPPGGVMESRKDDVLFSNPSKGDAVVLVGDGSVDKSIGTLQILLGRVSLFLLSLRDRVKSVLTARKGCRSKYGSLRSVHGWWSHRGEVWQ